MGGFPFNSLSDVIQNGPHMRPRSGPRGSRPGQLPRGAPVSTLQSLSPEQLAAIGVVAAAGTGLFDNTFYPEGFRPGQVFSQVTDNGDGSYGQVGVEYRIWITPAIGDTSQLTTWSALMFGPVQAEIVTWSGGSNNAWEFSGFGPNGEDFTIGGTGTSSVRRWGEFEPPYGFHIFVRDDPEQKAVPQNPGTQTITEIPYPLSPELPKPQDEAEEEDNRRGLGEQLSDIGDALQEFGELVTDLKETLDTKLDCNPCQILAENELRRIQDNVEVNEKLDDLMTEVEVEVSAVVDISTCEDPQDPVAVEGVTHQAVADLLTLLSVAIGNLRERVCFLENSDCAYPESWTDDKDPGLPVLLLRMREAEEGHPGRPRTRDFNLPNFDGNRAGSFPSWTRGNFKATARVGGNGELKVFCSTSAQASATIAALGAMCAGFDPATVVIAEGQGWVGNEVQLTPYKTLWFPEGRAGGPQPTEINNLETGQSWP